MSNLRVIVSALLKFVFPHQEYLVWKYTKMSAWAQGHSRSSVLVIVMLHLQDLECSAQQISAQRVWVSGPEAREACAGPPWPSAHLVPSSSRDPPAPCPPQPPSSSCELCPAGAARSAFPGLPSLTHGCWAPALGRAAPLRTRLTCGLQRGATTAAPASLGFSFISLWHKGEFLSPGDAFFSLIILC